MKKIQILGTGCPKCKTLTANAEDAAKALGIEYELQKITDIKEIMKFGIMMTPGLAIDDQVKSSGKVLSTAQVKKMLQ